MKSISEIILQECVPQKDCMLTLQDNTGEVGFFYFKDAELIEANYSSRWGKEAVEEVLEWALAEYTISPLPLGIKRSVWDPIELLLRLSSATESAMTPDFKAQKLGSLPTPYDNFKELTGVTKIFRIEGNNEVPIFDAENEPSVETSWIVEFYQRARSVGETLGFGKVQRWSLATDQYQVVGLTQNKELLGIVRKHDLNTEDFEAACEASVQKPGGS
jgi:hypothetical protein